MNYFECGCVYPSRCKALAPTRLVAPPTDRGHRPYRNADGRYERAGVGEFPPSPNARFFFGSPFRRRILSFQVEPPTRFRASPATQNLALTGPGSIAAFARKLPTPALVTDGPT